MTLYKTPLDGVYVIEPKVFGDNRGWFYESYSQKAFEQLGINTVFVQDNRSYSAAKGTLRGLHCQTEPMSQTKLVSCTKGEIFDVAVDVREGSQTYLKWFSVVLSEENKKMLYIPKGFLHGFLALTDDVEISYKVDEFYSSENDRSVAYNDPTIGVEWGISDPVLSEKDRSAPMLSESDIKFKYCK